MIYGFNMNHVIIIGAAKCGTTSLYHVLGQHPEICKGVEKEPNFFSRYPPKYKSYSDIWPNWNPAQHQWALEASVHYTEAFEDYKQVPKRMRDYGINPKLIYIVRDPWIKAQSWAKFHEQITWRAFENDKLFNSDYYSKLEAYVETFGKDNICVVQFEDFVANVNSVSDRIFDFLGVERIQVSPEWHLKAKSSLPEEFLESSYALNRKKQLMKQLQPNMIKLADEWGIDISRWGF